MASRYTLTDIRRETFRKARRERKCVCPFHTCSKRPLSLWHVTVCDGKRSREERLPLCELCQFTLSSLSGDTQGCYQTTAEFTECPSCRGTIQWTTSATAPSSGAGACTRVSEKVGACSCGARWREDSFEPW